MELNKNIREARGKDTDSNPDPLTGSPGAHPVGTGIGAAAGGAATGAAIGSVAGPVGSLIGIATGAVMGGLVGKSVAEKIDPTIENEYWKTNYLTRPYAVKGYNYEMYEPAYRAGYEGCQKHAGKSFEEAEPDLQHVYYSSRPSIDLEWELAKPAARDAWDRVAGRGSGVNGN